MQMNRTLVGPVATLGLISLTVLGGCSQQQANVPIAKTEMKQAAGTDASGLTTVVAKTRTAVEANNFSAAQSEFDQFESAWKPIEDGIKAKSPDNYDRIEASMDKISAGLRAAQPNASDVLANLKELDQTIQNIAK